MKQLTKRIVSLTLVLAVVLALVPASMVSAATLTELSIPVISVPQSSQQQTATAFLLSSENLLVGAFTSKTAPRADAGNGYIKINKTACFFSLNKDTVSSSVAQSYVAANGTNLSYDSASGKYVLFSYGVIVQPNTPAGTYYIDVTLDVLTSPEDVGYPYNPDNLYIQVNVVEAGCAHSTSETSAKDATCTEGGNFAYYTCSLCGKYFSDAAATEEIAESSWIIPALGHDMITDSAVEPTCTTEGKTEGSRCSRCDYKVAQQTVPALGHDWEDGVVTVEPTIFLEGELTYTCNRCGETRTETIPVIVCTHELVKTNEKLPTCTEEGNVAYYSCPLCGKYFSDAAATTEIAENSWIIPALGHNMVTDEAVAPTCTTEGKTEGSRCSRCDYKVAQQTIAALGHDMIAVPAVAATCTTAGKTEGGYCSRCDYKVAQQTVPALGHDWDDGVVTVEPTIFLEGELTYTCNRCGGTRTETIPVIVCTHELVKTNEKLPTCTEDGNVAYYSCPLCGKYFSDAAATTEIAENSWIIPALGHNMVADEAVAPTCTTEGKTEGSRCSRCDYKVAQQTVPPLGHDWDDGAVTIEPTASSEGEMIFTCTRCGGTRTETIPAVVCSHELVKVHAKRVLCTKAGNIAYYTCTLCGKYFSDAEATVEIEEDSWIISALGHDYISHAAQAATCTEVGWNAYMTCSRCSYNSYKEKAALGHRWNDGVVTVEPTASSEGEVIFACKRCGKTKTETFSAVDCSHILVKTHAKRVTCAKAGNSAYYTCTLCGKYFSDAAATVEIEEDSWIISALGHDYISHAAQAATCTEVGWNAYKTCSRCAYNSCREKAALGHDWDDGVVTVKPTASSEGEITFTCKRCGKIRTENIS